ncbi:ligase-associated DNA damage response endonuclease PdeM [Belliella buryatensis]|nr:ligase-associated DNA damage response endonuclease PdeM [Belliella buryatensis]
MPNLSKQENILKVVIEELGELCFLPEKALVLPEHKALLLADPHFGKAGHFRKAGVPISELLHDEDLSRISKLIVDSQAESVYFLGDLFHSDLNESWWAIEAFIDQFSETNFHLIKGNHDILPPACYQSGKWEIHEEPLTLGVYLLSHEPLEDFPRDKINICGHIHPGISLRGKGRQKVTLPCFFYSERRLIMPAFGRFTGLVAMPCTKSDQAYVIADEKVIRVN